MLAGFGGQPFLGVARKSEAADENNAVPSPVYRLHIKGLINRFINYFYV